MKHYSWFEVYRAAMLELDSDKISERIGVARQQLKERMQNTAGVTVEEQNAITDALNNLFAVESNERYHAKTAH